MLSLLLVQLQQHDIVYYGFFSLNLPTARSAFQVSCFAVGSLTLVLQSYETGWVFSTAREDKYLNLFLNKV